VRTGIFTVQFGEDAHRVTVAPGGEARVDGGAPIALEPEGGQGIRVFDGQRARQVFVAGSGDRRQVFVDGEVYDLVVGTEADGRPRPGRQASDLLAAPMPARVTAIIVEPGQRVARGDILLKLEAMKMELAVRAPHDGTVKSIACRVGELVQPGVGLMELV
jgi:3-methylcrotonyl-CoA carboxylase alpha subunit